ncbi:MAG: hypothetical protein R3A50_04800 [Saprospiraceae bacterium]
MEPINIFAADAIRNDLERALMILAQSRGTSVETIKQTYNITPFLCLMAVYLNTTSSTYSFHPRGGVDPAVPGTALLDQNDVFIFNQLGLRFGRCAYASNTPSNHGIYPKLTYPDPNYFTGTGTTAGDESDQLKEIVNGYLDLKVSGQAVIDKLACSELVFNPDATFTSSPEALPAYGGSPGYRGLSKLDPTFIIDGMNDNEFTVQLANGPKGNIDGNISTGTTDSGVRNILYIAAAGWKLKNFANGSKAIACS